MLLSQSCMYGIRAALLIATKGESDKDSFIPIRRIADQLDVSFHFLTKILQVLTHAKLMESYKGPNGGVRLARPAEELSLIDVVEAIDGNDVFDNCLLGLPGCKDDNPCPLHEKWSNSIDQLRALFQETSLAQLAKESSEFLYRLK